MVWNINFILDLSGLNSKTNIENPITKIFNNAKIIAGVVSPITLKSGNAIEIRLADIIQIIVHQRDCISVNIL